MKLPVTTGNKEVLWSIYDVTIIVTVLDIIDNLW
jgi:hypothetical protein